MLDWRERKKDGPARNKYQKIVIFKKVFDPKEFEVSAFITHARMYAGCMYVSLGVGGLGAYIHYFVYYDCVLAYLISMP